MGVTTTITAAMNDDNDGEDSAEDDTEESGAIGASPTGRFARPDYTLQGLLARARKRVKERGGRVNVAEGDGERVSQREVFFLLCLLITAETFPSFGGI